MPLSQSDKIKMVEDYSRLLEKSSGFFVFKYHGLSVDKINELRNRIRETESSMFVVKNRMLKRAISDKDYDGMMDDLVGPNAVIFAGDDPVAPAKALVNFQKDNEVVQIKSAVVFDNYMDASKVEALSKIPSQEELYAKILGGIKSPPTAVLGCLKAFPNKLHGLMVAYHKKLEEEAA